jgi:organic hydroperoxide reductase OsmC/OhrA
MRTSWTGNKGTGTSTYTAYSRDHELHGNEKSASILCSSDPLFRGDPSRYNPEELLLGAISGCHMLWMLHLCSDAGILVTEYEDHATATMAEDTNGAAQFTEAVLSPVLTITDASRIDDVERLHRRMHEVCALARSVNFPVHVRPRTEVVKTL